MRILKSSEYIVSSVIFAILYLISIFVFIYFRHKYIFKETIEVRSKSSYKPHRQIWEQGYYTMDPTVFLVIVIITIVIIICKGWAR
jgi:TRAP-type uncharacterized transport system fused permease subunit